MLFSVCFSVQVQVLFVPIERGDTVWHLGVIVDEKLIFKEHIYIVK